MGIVLGCACAHTHTDTRACSVASPKRKSHVSKPRCLQLCKAAQREEWVAGVKAEAGRGAQAGRSERPQGRGMQGERKMPEAAPLPGRQVMHPNQGRPGPGECQADRAWCPGWGGGTSHRCSLRWWFLSRWVREAVGVRQPARGDPQAKSSVWGRNRLVPNPWNIVNVK